MAVREAQMAGAAAMTDVTVKGGDALAGGSARRRRRTGRAPGSRGVVWALVAVAAVLIGTAALIVTLREEALVSAETNIARVDFVLAESLERLFQSIDVMLDELAADMAEAGTPGYVGSETLHTLLKQSLAGVPAVQRVMVFDAGGRPVNTSAVALPSPQPANDRHYFIAHRDNPHAGLFVGEPIQSRADGKWTFVLSRRISGPDGAFLGVVGASVNFQYLDDLFAAAAPEAGARVTLLRRDDMALLFRRPTVPDLYGRSMAFTETYRGIFGGGRTAGSGRYFSSLEMRDRVAAARHLSHQPFIVSVAVPEETILEPWRRLALGIGVAVLTVGLGLSALVLTLCRQIGRRRDSEVALAAAEDALDEERGRLWSVVDAATDAFWEWHLGTGMVDWSERCCVLMGLPAAGGVLHIEQVFGMIVPEDREGYRDAVRRHIEEGAPFDVEARWRALDGGVRWLASRGRLIRDAQGRPLRLVGANSDITERKRLEAGLLAEAWAAE